MLGPHGCAFFPLLGRLGKTEFPMASTGPPSPFQRRPDQEESAPGRPGSRMQKPTKPQLDSFPGRVSIRQRELHHLHHSGVLWCGFMQTLAYLSNPQGQMWGRRWDRGNRSVPSSTPSSSSILTCHSPYPTPRDPKSQEFPPWRLTAGPSRSPLESFFGISRFRSTRKRRNLSI